MTEETGIANSFENTTTSEKFSPLISMRRRHHSTNSTHVDPILSMADSSRTESFVNVTWDPTSPEGVTDASDQMRSQRLVIAFFFVYCINITCIFVTCLFIGRRSLLFSIPISKLGEFLFLCKSVSQI